MAPDAWGIDDGYWDIAGAWHDTPEDTRRALRVAMGGLADVADPPPATRPVWFVRQGSAPAIDRPAQLVLEDGTEVDAEHTLPADLPLGYHDLHPSDGGPATRLIVTPTACHLPAATTDVGLGARSSTPLGRSTSWGIGDLGDLATLARWSVERGRRGPRHQPAPRIAPDPDAGAESVLPEQPSVPQPDLPADRARPWLRPQRRGPGQARPRPAGR